MRTGFFCKGTALGSAQRLLQSRSFRLISRGHTSITSLLRPPEMVPQRHAPPSVDAPVAKRGNGATIRSAPTHSWQPLRRARQMLVGGTTTRISSAMACTVWLQATSKSAPMRAAPIRSVTSTVSLQYPLWSTSRNLAFVREYGLRATMLQCNLLLQINASQNGAALPLVAPRTLAGSGAWFHRRALPCLDGNLRPVIHPCLLPASRASWLITDQARAGAESGSACEANLRLLYMPQLSFCRKPCHRWPWLGWRRTAPAARSTSSNGWPWFSLL